MVRLHPLGSSGTTAGGGGMRSPSSLRTTQYPRFTGLVRKPGELAVKKTDMGKSPPRPKRRASSTRAQSSFPPLGTGHAVVLGQNRVDEGVVAVKQVEHRAIAADDVDEKANRLFVHGLAQLIREARKSLAIDRVVFLEAAETQPVPGELGGEAANPWVAKHAPGLREQDRC